MAIGIFYFLLILVLIRHKALFGVLKDPTLNPSILTFVFFLKALAVPAMYLFYTYVYGGIEVFDSGVFYRDSVELNRFAKEHPLEYLKALLGMQDDSTGSFFFENYIKKVSNWDNGRIRILFYNDNRIVIRLHSLLHFIAFGSYFVHALFSCLFSFIGLFWIYRSIKSYFPGKELALLLSLCLFPALWIHTGALLKEGIAVFIMGGMMGSVFTFLNGKKTPGLILCLLFLIFLSFLLKPYLLLYSLICFSLLFLLQKSSLRKKSLFYLVSLCGLFLVLDAGMRLHKNRSLFQIAGMRRVVFSDAAKGGIFLIDSVKLIRLKYDTSLVTELTDKKGFFTIKKDIPYLYWEHTHQQDTFICKKNTDTSTAYQLAYSMPESSSNLDYPNQNTPIVNYALHGFYYTLAYPLFFNAHSLQENLASFENIILLVSILVSVLGLFFSKRPSLPVFVFLSFALGECLLIAFTSPNLGAIVRYRSPSVIFLIISALYYIDGFKMDTRKNSGLP